jgi:hypothetical protein
VVDETVVPDGNVVDFPLDAGSVFRRLSELRVQEAESIVALGLGDSEDTSSETRVHEDALDTGDGLKRKASRQYRFVPILGFRTIELTLTRTTG